MKKITKQDKETINKRAKEVPESFKTVCRETELVRGFEAQDRGGARIFCSLADIVALMLQSLASVKCIICRNFSGICGRSDEDIAKISPPKVSRFRRPASQPSITKPNSCPFFDGLQNWSTKKRPTPGKLWRQQIRPSIPKTRNDTA